MNKAFGSPAHTWENNIKMDLKNSVWGCRLHCCNRDWWQVTMNMVLNLQVSLKVGNLLTFWVTAS